MDNAKGQSDDVRVEENVCHGDIVVRVLLGQLYVWRVFFHESIPGYLYPLNRT